MLTFTPPGSPVLMMDLPYTIEDHDGTPWIVLAPEAIDSRVLAADAGGGCLDDVIGADTINIDCEAIHQANSVLIAWMIRVAHAAKPRSVVLRKVNERQAVLLRRMRVDHLIEIRHD